MKQKGATSNVQEYQHLQTKNKNERLTREVVDREQSILDLQNSCARLEHENEALRERTDLAETKMQALEKFSSELQ
jgi:predicted  nucleic acid-binding Zn-ribbon protein